MDDAAGNCSDEQGSRGPAGLNAGGGGEDSARAFIIQVKDEVVRCVLGGMSKEQMFRELRERGLHPAVVFAVYKELRDQNNGFFREHYVKMDLRKQAERLKRLLHHYRTVRDAGAAGATTALGTAAQPTTVAIIPDGLGGLPEHRTVPIGSNGGACLVSSSSGDSRFAASAQTTRTLALNGQLLLLQREQPVIPNGGVHGTVPPSAACGTTSDGAMEVSCPWPYADNVGTMGWHGGQAEPLQQPWPGASVVRTRDSYWQPPSSVESPLENRDRQDHAAPRHGEQADEPMQERMPRRQPKILPEYRNHPVNVASRLGEQAVPLPNVYGVNRCGHFASQ